MRSWHVLVFFGATAALTFGAAFAACADYVPVQAKVIDAGVGVVDASADDLEACNTCMVQNCLTLCETDTICQDSIKCAAVDGCAYGRSQLQVLDCARPCLAEAGWVSGADNPTTNRLIGVSQCALNNCTDLCKPVL